ncbi:hypothetical protein FYJ45_25045 [Eisenbergiella tayi]|uniref:Uncharacterized protein n=1 Tax=Eisenbergiella porci TaxID=2652274 RepID=A0A6N7WA09_9FIRM|nr:hypothetical protein [Eisenbergiella porci]MSS91382.1 hypothetical protein [Eisenbergiella porci]
MQLTPNFRLMKPDGTDPVNVQDLNDNMDVLDAEVVKKLDKTGDASNVVNKFTQAGSRTNLLSGEKLSVSFGKIMKWFVDLKDVAFSGRYSDLTDRPTIPAGGIADKSKIIDNLDDIAANTQTGYIAGALAVKELNQNLGGLSFYEDETGKYVIGADSVPKKLGSDVKVYAITQTTNGSLNISSDFADYANITADNINIGITGGWTEHTYTSATGHTYVYAQIVSYDPATGVITYKLYSNGNVGAYQLNGYIIVHGS